jgi:predicted Ser/Thr protein kinase
MRDERSVHAFAFKILSRVFNFDHAEVAANPVHLFYVLEQQIEREQFPQEQAERYLEFLKGYLIPKYAEFIGKEIQTAYLESYSEYGQNIFDRYVTYADFGSRIRSTATRIPASCLTVNPERGAGKNREACRDQQPERLP